MDKKLALNYYARWKFVYDLMPLLEKAKAQGEEARVLTVLAAGTVSRIPPGTCMRKLNPTL
jgi:hypothetical protein